MVCCHPDPWQVLRASLEAPTAGRRFVKQCQLLWHLSSTRATQQKLVIILRHLQPSPRVSAWYYAGRQHGRLGFNMPRLRM